MPATNYAPETMEPRILGPGCYQLLKLGTLSQKKKNQQASLVVFFFFHFLWKQAQRISVVSRGFVTLRDHQVVL